MGLDTFVLGAFVAAVLIGLGALSALLRMQDHLADLKTERDAAREAGDDAVQRLNAVRADRDGLIEKLAGAQQRADEAERQLAEVKRREQRIITVLSFMTELKTSGPYAADAVPAAPSDPADDPWVIEMRARWADDHTSEQ